MQEIPTLIELEGAFRINKYGKAAHHDGVPTDLGHRFPHLLARHFHHLALKQCLCITEPVTLKGGVLIHAYKGRGPTTSCDNYRALMVSSVLSKAMHAILRRDCMQAFDGYRLPLQLGGLPGRSVSQGSQALLCFAHHCRTHNRSLGVLFIDIRQAFYRLFREHIVRTDDPDATVIRLFSTLGLPEDSFQEFARELDDATAMEEAGASAFVQAHVREAVSGTWFHRPGSSRMARTRKGSRPGDNLADLLFAFSFRRLLGRVVQELSEQGCDLTMTACVERHIYPSQLATPRTRTFDALGPIWADDLAVMLSDESPSRLLSKLQLVARTLFQKFAHTGMDMNLKKGKTELVLDVRGKGAIQVRKELFRHKPPVLQVETSSLGTIFISIVSKYKHLGTIFAHKGSMSPEIRARLGQARADFQRLRKRLFSNPALPERTRIQLFYTLVMTGLLYNIAVWPPLSRREEDAFVAGIYGLYGSVALAIWGEETITWRCERTAAKLAMAEPHILLRAARLRYLHHIVHKADDYVWGFIHLCPAWLGLLDGDLQWMQLHIPEYVPEIDPCVDWKPWHQVLCDRKEWLKLVCRAQKHAALQAKKHSEWDTWHRDILDLLKQHDIWKTEATVAMQGHHACLACKQRFKTKAAWSVHAFICHGRIAPQRRFATGVHCIMCNKVFRYHSALVNHLRYATRCLHELQRRQLRAPTEPSIGSRTERLVREAALAPNLEAYGPEVPELPQGAIEVGRDLAPHEETYVEALVDVFEEFLITRWTATELVDKVWEAMQRSTVYPHDLLHLTSECLDRYKMHLDEDDIDDSSILRALETMMLTIQQNWSEDWLMGHIPTTKQTSIIGHGTVDVHEEFRKLCQQQPRRSFKIQPLRIKCVILLHLFSGHRRHGDVQDEFEKLQKTSIYPLHGLSVDIVISVEFGNILNPATQRLFRAAIHDGYIGAIVAGPPCGTWRKQGSSTTSISVVLVPCGQSSSRRAWTNFDFVNSHNFWSEMSCLESLLFSATRRGLRDALCCLSIHRSPQLKSARPFGS